MPLNDYQKARLAAIEAALTKTTCYRDVSVECTAEGVSIKIDISRPVTSPQAVADFFTNAEANAEFMLTTIRSLLHENAALKPPATENPHDAHQRARIKNLLNHGVTIRVPRGQDLDAVLTTLEAERGITPPPATTPKQ